MRNLIRKLNTKIATKVGIPLKEVRAVNTLLNNKKVYNYVDIERFLIK